MGKQACTISRMAPVNRLKLDPMLMSRRRCPVDCPAPGTAQFGGPSFPECSRAGEALFSMLRRDREWELEEGAKEAAW
jgi:hypothetical protein